MADKDKDLMKLYRDRVLDRSRYTSKRRRALEARPKPFSDLIEGYFKGDSEALRKIDENRAIAAWSVIVGEAAARVSQPLRVRAGKLIVRVADPLWMQQLSLLKHELLRKYQTGFPKLKIRDIYFTRT
jgi:hypothetical protein